MINDMFESKTVIKLNEDTWIIPEGYRIVKLPDTNNMVKKLHDVCESHESCKDCPLINSKVNHCLTLGDPDKWDIDEIVTRLEVAGR